MRWLLVALFTTAAALAAGQNAPSLPEGDGKALVTGACASCHGLDLITAKQATRDEWSGVVERMKSYGMAMDAKETTIVVDYLTKNFGPKTATPPAPTPAPAPAPAPQDDPAADAAGKALVDGMCASCHGVDLVTGKQATRAEWQATIDRMKTYGLAIDEKQNATLLDYLVRKYGPKQAAAAPVTPAATTVAAAADPGKALLDAFCSNCHDLDLVSGRTATQAEWQDIVDRMNGRGAGVPEKDIPVMVAYLAKTYPVKK